MLHRIKKILFPMNSDLENYTLDEYKRIRNLSISIYIVTIQIFYCFKDKINFKFLDDVFVSKDLEEFVFGIFISATTFSLIYFTVSLVWQRVWISLNKDNCYFDGTWYHVFDREVDKNKKFIRAGFVTISQNFYDISVTAYNYDIYINNEGMITYDPKTLSNWHFSLCSIKKDGTIDAKFVKQKEYNETLSNKGVMMLLVHGRDYKDNVNELVGTFSDSGFSTVKGNIRMFKSGKKAKKSDFDFLGFAPDVWKEYIRNQLTAETGEERTC